MAETDPAICVMTPFPRWLPQWAVPEVPVPESDVHDLALTYLTAVLRYWAERSGRSIKVARNLGIRWVEQEPRAGFDPDICVIEPAPPDQPLTSLRLWNAEHAAPRLAAEVVSPGHPYKDYLDTPARCAAAGIGELWIYDPLLAGPRSSGGPFLLQLWRLEGGAMRRVHAAGGPTHSVALNAWLHPTVLPAAQLASATVHGLPAPAQAQAAKLRIADSEDATEFWPTAEEAERARADGMAREADELRAQLARLKAR